MTYDEGAKMPLFYTYNNLCKINGILNEIKLMRMFTNFQITELFPKFSRFLKISHPVNQSLWLFLSKTMTRNSPIRSASYPCYPNLWMDAWMDG
jgi:hypothetical protein